MVLDIVCQLDRRCDAFSGGVLCGQMVNKRRASQGGRSQSGRRTNSGKKRRCFMSSDSGARRYAELRGWSAASATTLQKIMTTSSEYAQACKPCACELGKSKAYVQMKPREDPWQASRHLNDSTGARMNAGLTSRASHSSSPLLSSCSTLNTFISVSIVVSTINMPSSSISSKRALRRGLSDGCEVGKIG
jgi:hypothetical protein